MELTRTTWLLSYYLLHVETIKCCPLSLTCGMRDLIELLVQYLEDLWLPSYLFLYADVGSHVLVLHWANLVLMPSGMVHIELN